MRILYDEKMKKKRARQNEEIDEFAKKIIIIIKSNVEKNSKKRKL